MRKLFRRRREPILKFETLQYRVGRLVVGPDDIIVLSTDLMLDKDQCMQLQARAKEWFPDHKVMVMSAGIKLGVVRK